MERKTGGRTICPTVHTEGRGSTRQIAGPTLTSYDEMWPSARKCNSKGVRTRFVAHQLFASPHSAFASWAYQPGHARTASHSGKRPLLSDIQPELDALREARALLREKAVAGWGSPSKKPLEEAPDALVHADARARQAPPRPALACRSARGQALGAHPHDGLGRYFLKPPRRNVEHKSAD